MKEIRKQIESILISREYYPSTCDYIRGHCLYKLGGYIQPNYVIYEEPLKSFKTTSKIYNYGVSILNKYNLDLNEWTLLYHTNPEWYNSFTLTKI